MAGFDLLSDQGLRLDGRRTNELRKIQCKLGVFSQPDGSSYLEQGNTKVLAAVYGPHEIRGSRTKCLLDQVLVNCQYSMATFSTGERKRRPRGDRKSQEMSSHLRQTFEAAIKTELYPRSQIDIFVEVLQADGGNYSACVNAATLALIDAGIPLHEYVTSCTTVLAPPPAVASWDEEKREEGEVPLVDASHREETSGSPTITVAALAESGRLVLCQVGQRLHLDRMNRALQNALQGCKDVRDVLDAAVRDHVALGGIGEAASS
ncbi:exosome complex component RRP41 [Hetaerina americana]|uniref:exosome complex component RRP41 n=1 Tax=Hetaerina americana TaxID=62018 RepID=UPI003A7F4DD5